MPKGIQIVDPNAPKEVLPRVWNDLAHRISKMTDAEREENDKSIRAREFIFCGNYEGVETGTVVYITPESFFREEGKVWEKALDIAHLLPGDLKEVAPGVYRSMSRDWNHVSFDMAQRGFTESLRLQLALNAL